MKKTLKKLLPGPLRNVVKKVYNVTKDNYELVSGQRDSMTPPKRLMFVGKGDFKKIGDSFVEYFINIGNLKPDDHVLDVGCGIGRMALPLTKYLSKNARYEGFDIVPEGIKWCQKKITPLYPNFHFQLADIKNLRYHPSGKYEGSVYRFPYEDKSFDFVFLTSVFTHLLPADLENYLSEIARVMRPGATCFITFFILNSESEALISAGKSDFKFKYRYENHAVESEKGPEDAVAYKEQYVRDLFKSTQLEISGPIRFGYWCGRNKFSAKKDVEYQDIIIAKK